MSLLLIEPSTLMRRQVRAALFQLGLSATAEVKSVTEAQARLSHFRYGVILFGPGILIHEASNCTATLRGERRHEGTQVLLISDRATHEDVLEAVESGVNTYILAPFEPMDLAMKVQEALHTATPPQVVKAEQKWHHKIHRLPRSRSEG